MSCAAKPTSSSSCRNWRRRSCAPTITTITATTNIPTPTPDALAEAGPDRDCALCPRLVRFRHAQRSEHAYWHNAPVPSFGALDARLLIVGLAPGLKGANRTGRPFTGDFAGDLLYATLREFGFAHGDYAARADDGLALVDCRISNAVRCVPPGNKPLPAEINACRPYLISEIAAMKRLAAILALGQIAHGAA